MDKYIFPGNMVIFDMWYLGPCHCGMACPKAADGGMAASMEVSCEYIV